MSHFKYPNVFSLVFLLSLLISLSSCQSSQPLKKTDYQTFAFAINSADCNSTLQQARHLFSQLENYDSTTLESADFLQLFNRLEIVIDNGYSKAQLQSSVHPDLKIREQADTCIQEFSSIYTNLGLSRPVYDALSQIDISSKNKSSQRYQKKLLKDFRRSGVDKDQKTRDRIKELNQELTRVGQLFSKNIREDVRSVKLDSVEQLKGLPEDYINSHKPDESGKIVITTNYPDFFPIVRYAENDDLKKEMYTLFRNLGYPANEPVLKDILKLRYELANLLGYPDFATFITEDKMIRSPEKAQAFIDDISSLVDPIADEDYQILLTRLKKINPEASSVKAWQKGYLSELVKRETYDFDSRQLRQYFTYSQVESGIFDILEEMFAIQIIPWQTETWHETIRAFKVMDNGAEIGRFYLDMHPRDNKYKHAAHFPLMSGVDGVQLPVSVLVCNFPGEDPDNAHMEHGQVETFLHEFGHLIHHIFAGKQQWIGFSGVATERDFVEAPSQMLEEWVWNASILKRFAVNDKGETISDELISKMLAAKQFGEGLNVKNQMYYAALSLNYYRQNPDNFDLTEEMIRLSNRYSNFEHIENTHFYANFGHLVGYSAMYYTYMWSLVIAADMFSDFDQNNLLDTTVADHYRQTVLAPGGSEDADNLVTSFLGRPYSFTAYENKLKRN